jgi:AraC-like DNA-binding protein
VTVPFSPGSEILFKNDVVPVFTWDIADRDEARRLTIRVPPGNGLLLIANYRERAGAERRFESEIETCREHQFAASQVQSGVVNVCPRGPFGIAGIYIQPEAALPGFGSLKEFANAKVDLRDIFRAVELDRLHEQLARSRQSSERMVLVEGFLGRNGRRSSAVSAAQYAAKSLRARPGRRVSGLAAEMSISERHLSRLFHQSFGVSPKRFATVARIEKMLAARREGLTWTEATYASGFCDQSHMIRDFKKIVGQSPVEFFHATENGTELLVGGSNLTFSVTDSREDRLRKAD